MKRRQFAIGTLALAALAPLAPLAQQPPKVRRIAVLNPFNENGLFKRPLSDALKRVGYSDKNLRIDWRSAEGKNERLDALARELVALKPELIIAVAYEGILAAKQATRDIPIVMVGAWFPVENGFIKSFARPGGNITGTSWTGLEQQGKALEILREAAPKERRVAVAWDPAYRFSELWREEIDRAGKRLGMNLQYVPITTIAEVTPALEKITHLRPDALFIAGNAIMIARAKEVADFTIERKLVAVSLSSALVDLGALMYFGPDVSEMLPRVASFVDRILRGAKPADLPAELPSKFELVINAKTARAIGHKIPPALLGRADLVID